MPYRVTLIPSQQSFTVEEDEYILDGALRQGIAFPYQCKTGSCATCLGNVVSGEIHYPQGLPLTVMEHEHEQGQAVFCVSVAKSDLTLKVSEIDTHKEIQLKSFPARVSSLRKLADDVMEMTLQIPSSETLPFHAGQYIEIIMRDKSRRAFSIANSPSNEGVLELHIRHVPEGIFTGHVFSSMKEKAILRIEGPYGGFYIRDDSKRPLILIAGGTGFAPLKAMIEKLIEDGSTRPIFLYWGARAEADLYRSDLAKKWAFQHEHINYIPVLSENNDTNTWEGRTGFVHHAVLDDIADLSEYDVYIAGPPVMVNAAKSSFSQRGLAAEQFYADLFVYANEQ